MFPGLVNFVPDVAYHFCLFLNEKFSQPELVTTLKPIPVQRNEQFTTLRLDPLVSQKGEENAIKLSLPFQAAATNTELDTWRKNCKEGRDRASSGAKGKKERQGCQSSRLSRRLTTMIRDVMRNLIEFLS